MHSPVRMERTPELPELRPRPPGRRIPAALWDAAEEARRLLTGARERADAVLEEARARSLKLEDEARTRGRDAGLARAASLLAEAAAVRGRVLAEAEGELVDLAFAIARSVLGRIVEGEREAVVETARRALELARDRAEVRVRAHPEDLEALRRREPLLARGLARARGLSWVGDPGVARGGVVVETEVGAVEASLEIQLDALRRALTEGGPAPAAPGDRGEPSGEGA